MKFSNLVPTTIKIFLTTFILLALFFVYFEFFNTRIHSTELIQRIRTVMLKSCRYMELETYKTAPEGEDGKATFGNCYTLKDGTGVERVSGKFYNGNNREEIFESLFVDNDSAQAYIAWLDSSLDSAGFVFETCRQNTAYKLLKDLMNATNITEESGTNSFAKKYYITPANLGFTYLDEEILEKIFKWMLVNELTVNSVKPGDYTIRDLIQTDSNGPYVLWYGFRIYYDTLDIDIAPTNGRLKLYDLNIESDAEELQEWTGIDLNRYRYGGSSEDDVYHDYGNYIEVDDIRRFKILYDIRWTMKISYEGILPIKLLSGMFYNGGDFELILDDDGGSDFSTPVAVDLYTNRLTRGVQTTMNGDGQSIRGNENFFNAPVLIGNNNDEGVGLGNFKDASYGFDIEKDYIGSRPASQDGVLGLAQRMKFVVIY